MVNIEVVFSDNYDARVRVDRWVIYVKFSEGHEQSGTILWTRY
jgi:hypothetical protein